MLVVAVEEDEDEDDELTALANRNFLLKPPRDNVEVPFSCW